MHFRRNVMALVFCVFAIVEDQKNRSTKMEIVFINGGQICTRNIKFK